MLPDLPELESEPAADTDLLTSEEAAAKLKVTPGHLARLRVEGGGPQFVKLSRKLVRYRPFDLREYVKSRLRTSTSDRGE